MVVLQTLLIEGNHLKEIFLFFLEFAFWVFLHQLLYLLLYDCEFQTQVILASQDLQNLTKSNTQSHNEKHDHNKLFDFHFLCDIAVFFSFSKNLELASLVVEIFQVMFNDSLVDVDKGTEFIAIDLKEKGGKKHAINSYLIAVNVAVNSFNDALIFRLFSQYSGDFLFIGLPSQSLALGNYV